MRNIYELFDSRQETIIESEYERIQEGYDEIIILEKEIYTNTLESLVYNNPEKKKLSVLMEEAEGNATLKRKSLADKLKEQMKKVLNWLSKIFDFHQKRIDAGVKLVKSADLNQCINKLKREGSELTTKYHPRKTPFDKISNKSIRRINKSIYLIKAHTGSKLSLRNYDEEQETDYVEERLENNLKEYKLDKENLQEVKLTALNPVVIENTLLNMPSTNRYLKDIKNKVQDAYNSAINSIRNDHADDTKARQSDKAGREVKSVNRWMKITNERIRTYSKLMNIIFNEEYSAARKIIAASRGEKITDEDIEKRGDEGEN
jgi:hypothetical protein